MTASIAASAPPPAQQATLDGHLLGNGGADLPLTAAVRRRARTIEAATLAVAGAALLAFVLPLLGR